MKFIVATNVVASRPPERRPTGTPHASANYQLDLDIVGHFIAKTPYSWNNKIVLNLSLLGI